MPTSDAPTPDDRRMCELWLSGLHQPAIVAADDAGVFVALAEAPATVEELAMRLGFDQRATGILLRLLAALGLLTTRLDRFHLSDEARTYLLTSSPWYWRPMLRVAAVSLGREARSQLRKLRRRRPGSGRQGRRT